MLKNYLSHVAEREALGIPPLPLDAKQTQALTELLEKPNAEIDKIIPITVPKKPIMGAAPAMVARMLTFFSNL